VDNEGLSSDEDNDEDFDGSSKYYFVFYAFHLDSADFINDEEPFANNSHPQMYTTLTTLEQEDALEALLARINERARIRSQSMDSSGREHWTDTLGRLPSTTDYPLWRVRCRVVLFL